MTNLFAGLRRCGCPFGRDPGRLLLFVAPFGVLVATPAPSFSQSTVPVRALSVLVAAQLADAHSTAVALASSPHVLEANPLMRACAPRPACLWPVKAGSGIAAAWLLSRVSRRTGVGTAVPAAGLIATVSYRNFRVARYSRGRSAALVAGWLAGGLLIADRRGRGRVDAGRCVHRVRPASAAGRFGMVPCVPPTERERGRLARRPAGRARFGTGTHGFMSTTVPSAVAQRFWSGPSPVNTSHWHTACDLP